MSLEFSPGGETPMMVASSTSHRQPLVLIGGPPRSHTQLARWSNGPAPDSAPSPIPHLTAAIESLMDPDVLTGTAQGHGRDSRRQGGLETRAPASRASIGVWSRIRLPPDENPKPETGRPWFDQSLVKERRTSIFYVRGIFFVLDERGPDRGYALYALIYFK